MITSQLTQMIGTSPPKLLVAKTSSIDSMLAANTLDIGMCGYLITLTRLNGYDFTPLYMPSGFQAVIKRPTTVPTPSDVIFGVIGCIDSKAQLIFLFLLCIVFLQGHLIAVAENVSKNEERNLRSSYFESTMDGMWLSVVTLSTVGFGDLYPTSLIGRILSVAYIFVSIMLMSMLIAVVTSNFLGLQASTALRKALHRAWADFVLHHSSVSDHG